MCIRDRSNPSDAYDFLTCALESEGPTVLVVEKSLAEYDFNAENISVTHTQDADKPTNKPFEAKRILKGEEDVYKRQYLCRLTQIRQPP